MRDLDIAPVHRADIGILDKALQALSKVLGDPHVADQETLMRGVFGPHPSCHALLARRGDAPMGALVWSPYFSTTNGGGGLFVSDLWVAEEMRGAGLGVRLLQHAIKGAAATSGAQFVKLAVHDSNSAAARFYERLGFTAQTSETTMMLRGAALAQIKRGA